MGKLQYKVKKGDYTGQLLLPHKYPEDGRFVASTSRFKIDYIRLDTEEELEALVRSGYSARMSNPHTRKHPNLIRSRSITFAESESSTDFYPHTILPRALEDVDLDIDSISKSRKEQAFLRAHLCNGNAISSCTICQNEYPIELLVAAHIKKRSECNSSEKLDFSNVAGLMCKLGCDELFEKGYIFVSDGKVTKNPNRVTTIQLDTAISSLTGNKVPNWAGSQKYYNHHENIFAKPKKKDTF
jgi:hypothetical protein